MDVTMPTPPRPAGRGPTMQEKVDMLRALVAEVEIVAVADLSKRWGVTHEGARKFMDGAGAPVPVIKLGAIKGWALPEVEHYRSTRLLGSRS